MQQPGMVMHQREVRPCNIAKPLAQVLTTTEGLAAAKAKDDRKNIAVTKRKMTALATIGKELGKTVNIDGVDLVASGPRVRNVFCEFCKRTMTRACRLESCRKKALGLQSPDRKKIKKRNNPKDEYISDEDDSDYVTDVDGDIEEYTTIMAKATKDPWVHDPKGTLAIGKMFNTMLLTEDVSHDGLPSKVTRCVLFEKKFNMLEFKYVTENGNWDYELSSVQEVYEALLASTSTVFPASALAHFTKEPYSFKM